MKYYEDMIREHEEPDDRFRHPPQTIFRILTDEKLPFYYELRRDGTCIADADEPALLVAAFDKRIQIIKENVPYRFEKFQGGPEPILDGILKFAKPTENPPEKKGKDIEIIEFGGWQCQRCEHVNYVPVSVEKGKSEIVRPFQCENETCGRKGPFKPAFPLDLVKPIWELPLSPIETSSIEVYSEVLQYAKKHLVLKEDEYHIFTLWALATWLVEDFDTVSYLIFLAPKESGKTQAILILKELAYRAVPAIDVKASGLFRAIESWDITLLIDEADFQLSKDTEHGQALYAALNGGYKRGLYAIRSEQDGDTWMPQTFEVFGFKAIATTKLFHPTLESRGIPFHMTQAKPQNILIDKKWAAIIRSKLLYWRFEHLGKLPLVMPESSSGRLIEMFIPLYTVAQTLKGLEGVKLPITYSDLIKILDNKIRELEKARKQEERESLEADIIQAISDLSVKAMNESLDERTCIQVKEISEHLGWDGEKGDPRSPSKVGYRLKAMGIRTEKAGGRKGNLRMVQHLEEPTKSRLRELEKRFLEPQKEEKEKETPGKDMEVKK